MPFSWSALHAHLLSQSTSLQFERHYLRVRKNAPNKLPSGDAAALLGFLQDPAGDPEAKNVALRALVAVVQADEDLSQNLTVLLLLALWPGLDALRNRLKPFCRNGEDLDAELTGRLTIAVGDLDLARVQRIAATLLLNLERDMRRHLQRRAREVPQAHLADDGDAAFEMMFAPVSRTNERCVGTEAALLSRLLGDDARLVLLVVVAGYNQREVAALLGISHDVARKRYQRAMARLRLELQRACPKPDS